MPLPAALAALAQLAGLHLGLPTARALARNGGRLRHELPTPLVRHALRGLGGGGSSRSGGRHPRRQQPVVRAGPRRGEQTRANA
eukprot:8256679-Lingulodinium_polyedra.AAC.1